VQRVVVSEEPIIELVGIAPTARPLLKHAVVEHAENESTAGDGAFRHSKPERIATASVGR
jgi:hypothetical protein